MANKQRVEAADIVTGRNIYTDKKGRTVYYKPSTKQGFVVRPGTGRTFKTYMHRYIVAFIAAIFVYVLLLPNILFALGIGVAAFVFMQFRWMKLLNTYTMIQNFEPEQHESTLELIKQLDSSALILRIALYLLLAVLIVLNSYNMYTQTPDQQTLILAIASCVVSIFALYMAARYIYALSTKNK